MRIEDALEQLKPIEAACECDDDAMLFCYFSREQDEFRAVLLNMDAGDALIVINGLIEQFGLDPALVGESVGSVGALNCETQAEAA